MLLDLPILTEFVLLAQLTSLPVLPPLTELPVEMDSTYPLHGLTVLLAQPELLPVLPPLTLYLVNQDIMLPQSVDLKSLVLHVQLTEILLLVTKLIMLSPVNQDSLLPMDHVLHAQLMLNHVKDKTFSHVTLDST